MSPWFCLHCLDSPLHHYPTYPTTTVSPTVTPLPAVMHACHDCQHGFPLRKPKAVPLGRHKAPHVHAHPHESPHGEAEAPRLGNANAVESHPRVRHRGKKDASVSFASLSDAPHARRGRSPESRWSRPPRQTATLPCRRSAVAVLVDPGRLVERGKADEDRRSTAHLAA